MWKWLRWVLLGIGIFVLIILSPIIYTSNWKKFESSKNGFSFKYPRNWNLETIRDDYLGLSSYSGDQGSFPPKGEAWFIIWVQELKTESFEQLVSEVAQANNTKEKEVKFSGADKAYDVGNNYRYLKKGNKFYSILIHGNKMSFKNRLDTILMMSYTFGFK